MFQIISDKKCCLDLKKFLLLKLIFHIFQLMKLQKLSFKFSYSVIENRAIKDIN